MCSNCDITDITSMLIPPEKFYSPYLEYFLHDIPTVSCGKG